jgi:hypothetical protein
MAQRREQRAYPLNCRSLYCGEIGRYCPATCQHLPELQEFLDWVIRTQAQPVDPVWSPTIWQASR